MASVMHLLKARDHTKMPWKNGGGVTTEIAVHPGSAIITDFDWRVSIASVTADGPFSQFKDVDRTIVVLDGHGMRLKIGEAPAQTLTSESDPLSFPADVESSAELTQGPIQDLNVMTRRGRWRHSVARVKALTPATLAVDAPEWLLVAHGGPARIETSGKQLELEAGDALRGNGPVSDVRIRESASLFRIELWPVTGQKQ